ncbi:hypothetical protein HWV62_28348 [Athelia sp. TMB]|nr:hypothetical protein HWV62_28348 [Athelia sp. TMB]
MAHTAGLAHLANAPLLPHTSRLPSYSQIATNIHFPNASFSTSQPHSTSTLPWSTGTYKTPEFEISEVPVSPVGKRRQIRTAAALIIGYTLTPNLHLRKRIEVISDNEAEIVEAARRLVAQYDFVVTSGGIGPTHDDITYPSLSRAFSCPLKHHPETLRRMRAWPSGAHDEATEEQTEARERMALLPSGWNVDVLYVKREIWTPVVRLEGKLHVFPGIPALFQAMLDGLTPFLFLPPLEDRPTRIQVFTSLTESCIAPFLTSLQNRVQDEGIRIGSYPVLQKGVYVSLIGANRDRVHELSAEIQAAIEGKEVSEEDVALEKKKSWKTRIESASGKGGA